MRFIVVTANFAPRTGSHPTRTVHLTKFLRRLGHSVTVVTYDERQHSLYGDPDLALLAKVPSDVQICRIPAGWLHRFLQFAKQRGHKAGDVKRRTSRNPLIPFLIPDPHCTARRSFVRAISKAIQKEGCDVLITCSYPFTLTLVGAEVKGVYPDLVWIADYGDPWSGAPFSELLLPNWRRFLDHQLERHALADADAVTVTTEPTASLYRAQFPHLRDKIGVVSMGYDPDDSASIEPASRLEGDRDKLVLLHAGRLNSDARDPEPFVSALESCLFTDPDIARSLKIVLLGDVEPQIATAISLSPAADLFEIHGWVDGAESIARMKSADLLLLFGNRGAQQIPGKVFQYIGTGRPIFMTCETQDDPTAAIVRQYGSSLVVPNKSTELAAALRQILADASIVPTTSTDCSEFAWPKLAERLARIACEARDRRLPAT